MRRFCKILAVLAFFVFICAPQAHCEDVKKPNVAGGFYPADGDKLKSMVDEFILKASPEAVEGEIFALISPHAGYGFSGAVAAFGFKLIKGKPYKTVIVIAGAHYHNFSGVAIYPQGTFRTPLGDLEIDKDFAQKLLNKDPEVFSRPSVFGGQEHMIEVQLPFLQRTLKGFRIVPVIMGDCALNTCKKFAGLLKEAIGARKDVLVVVSTDMYHGYDYDEADGVDRLTLNHLKNMDAEGLYYALRESQAQLCGGFSAVSAIVLAKELGHNKLVVLKHTNSAYVTGNLNKGSWTVGYSSCVIDQEKEKGMLNTEQRKRLLELARKTIEVHLKTGKRLEVKEADPVFNKEMGAFVTLRLRGELKGCIGNIIGRGPMYLAVRDLAIESATRDPRFTPVRLEELKDIEIEISVLSVPETIKDPDKIIMGVHGVIVRRGFNSGIFLPQVATETGWSKDEFMNELCAQKAGLPADAWRDPSTEIQVFTAEVFSENQ